MMHRMRFLNNRSKYSDMHAHTGKHRGEVTDIYLHKNSHDSEREFGLYIGDIMRGGLIYAAIATELYRARRIIFIPLT